MKLKPLTLEVGVDDKKVERRLTKIKKATENVTEAFGRLNAELEKSKEINIVFTIKTINKKWYQFWK